MFLLRIIYDLLTILIAHYIKYLYYKSYDDDDDDP